MIQLNTHTRELEKKENATENVKQTAYAKKQILHSRSQEPIEEEDFQPNQNSRYSCMALCGRLTPCNNRYCSNYKGPNKKK